MNLRWRRATSPACELCCPLVDKTVQYLGPTPSMLGVLTSDADHLRLLCSRRTRSGRQPELVLLSNPDPAFVRSAKKPSEGGSLRGNVLHLLPVMLPSGITSKLVTALNFTPPRTASTFPPAGQPARRPTLRPRLNLISEFIRVGRDGFGGGGGLTVAGKLKSADAYWRPSEVVGG